MKNNTIVTKNFSVGDVLRIVIISILATWVFIFTAMSISYFIETPFHNKESQTGTVRSKSDDEITIKNGAQTELYLNVDFDNIGFKSIEVEPTTYFSSEVGEIVTFKLTKKKTNLEHIKFLWGFIVIFLGSIGLIVFFIKWLFKIE